MIDKKSLQTLAWKRVISKADPAVLHSAHGPVSIDQECPFQSQALGEEVSPALMDDTPAGLSVGFRTMHRGWGYYWALTPDPLWIKPQPQGPTHALVEAQVETV